tara:strand:+ start:142 stop:342 length:201 start_codon:yes stop_codon:yes gene_type:complete
MMTGKEYVTEKHPRARVEFYKSNNPFVGGYWLCWTKYNGNRLSEGKTASNAWVNAKKNIKEELTNL